MGKEKTHYHAEGIVFGNFWGGGRGYYPAERYREDNFSEMKEIIKEDFEKGALDSGMGYESLVGALMFVTKVSTIEYEGKEYVNESTRKMWLGEIDKEKALDIMEI